MSATTEKPPCWMCNPLPDPAMITFDECPACAEKNKQEALARFREARQHAALTD